MNDERVRDAAAEWMRAPRKDGQREAIVQALARDLGVSRATAYRRLSDVTLIYRQRKRRSDYNTSGLTRDEAVTISAYIKSATRANGKQLVTIGEAARILRANGEIRAEHIDRGTGEIKPLSDSAIARGLRAYSCHPGQLDQPTPKISLRSEHPNHCWQIDPSLCVLYYLRRETGLRAMPVEDFNKNRPQNLDRIESDRVWRYVIVDHTTGALYVEYVLGAETGPNLAHCFINAMQWRGTDDPFCGVPRLVMVDQGSANKSAMFRNLCTALGVEVWFNKPKQPWAKGAVEKHNDLVEKKFESGLSQLRVGSLDELNAAAHRWRRRYCATERHTRHGMTRYEAWRRIKPEQLRFAPSIKVCRSLANSAPVERIVHSDLRVRWNGKLYDVSRVPDVIVGQHLTLARNAWDDENTAQVLGTDEDGPPLRIIVPARARGDFGFVEDAVTLGDYRGLSETRADAMRKQVERVLMDAATDAEAEAKRKAGALPFGGRINPYREIEEQESAGIAWLPPRGHKAEVVIPEIIDTRELSPRPQPIRREFEPFNHVEAAVALKPLVERKGQPWTAELYARTAAHWPDGLPRDQVEAWAAVLAAPTGGLRLIAGGAE